VNRHISALFAAVAACVAGFALPTLAAPPSPADFARAAAISDVSIARDGQHIVALTSPDGEHVNLSVWNARALESPPVVIGSTHMRFIDVRFLKDDRLLVTAIQPFTAGVQRVHLTKQYVTDLQGNHWASLLPSGRTDSELAEFYNSVVDATIVDLLPLDPDNVLVADNRIDGSGDIYRVNVHTGSAERVERGSERYLDRMADLKGEIRAKTEINYKDGKVYFAQWLKNPDTGAWEEHFRWYAKDRSPISVVGFSSDPGIAYIAASKGTDKTGFYEYDVRNRRILEPLFEHKLFEASDIIQSKDASDYGAVLGFVYQADQPRVYWADERLAALDKGLRSALGIHTATVDWVDPGTGQKAKISTPVGADARIISWSGDRKLVIVEKSGPRQPPEFYLLDQDRKISLLGRARPWLDTTQLGDARMVEYPARDGLMIPAFLTTPPSSVYGPGPYPLLVEPHGGPWARDEMGWDVSGWTQYFASRGYAVLQPQFRGSQGWGAKLWRAGDNEWGQKMQDDNDDGAKWLIAQKIAAPDRIAMFGYSYGGYAALVAAIRPNGIYQCSISGAGAGDLASLQEATFENRFQREFQNPTIAGLDALQHAREASIPVFLYHGDRDAIVDIKQSRKFANELKAAGKPYKFEEIPDMGHQYMTMTPAMLEKQLVDVEGFLKTGCGAGGL